MIGRILAILLAFILHRSQTEPLQPKTYFNSLGCYRQTTRPADNLPWYFHVKLHPLMSSSLSLCLLHCRSNKFIYAGIDSETCGCANGFQGMPKAADSECGRKCTELPFAEMPCGGDGRRSVYQVIHSGILDVLMGCFTIYPMKLSIHFEPLVSNSPFKNANRTIDEGRASQCIKHCAHRGFVYAAVYQGVRCGCDQDLKTNFTKTVSNLHCTQPCVDFRMGSCGSKDHMMVTIYRSDDAALKWLRKALDSKYLEEEPLEDQKDLDNRDPEDAGQDQSPAKDEGQEAKSPAKSGGSHFNQEVFLVEMLFIVITCTSLCIYCSCKWSNKLRKERQNRQKEDLEKSEVTQHTGFSTDVDATDATDASDDELEAMLDAGPPDDSGPPLNFSQANTG